MKIAFLGIVALGGLLCTDPAVAQPFITEPPEIPCPDATSTTRQMTTPAVVNSEFTPAVLAYPRAGFNHAGLSKYFLGTFRWKKTRACCQITAAVLTVVIRANQQGLSAPTSNDPGNDTIGIWGGGGPIAGLGGAIYPSGPVALNQLVTRTVVMNAAALAKMNANDRISFLVQDDSRVVSASLRIERCCVNP